MSTHYTVGQLARACAISRTALLYYEKIGLLLPAARSDAGYRRYGEAELARLRRLLAYRDAGLPLATIGALLDGGDQAQAAAGRLDEIARDMAGLRAQQGALASLVTGGAAMPAAMDKESWSALFLAMGMDEAAMRRWHRLFEQNNPAAHEAFLRQLGLGSDEVARIRAESAG